MYLGPLSKNCNKTNSFTPIPFLLYVSVKVNKRYVVMNYHAFMFTRSDAKLIFSCLSNWSNLHDVPVKRTP